MQKYFYVPKGCAGYIAGIGITVVAIALMIMTTNYRTHTDVIGCFGMDGVGYPIAWACNYSGAGSPISSIDRIDEDDAPYLSPHGFFLDVIVYSLPFWLLWFALAGFLRRSLA